MTFWDCSDSFVGSVGKKGKMDCNLLTNVAYRGSYFFSSGKKSKQKTPRLRLLLERLCWGFDCASRIKQGRRSYNEGFISRLFVADIKMLILAIPECHDCPPLAEVVLGGRWNYRLFIF